MREPSAGEMKDRVKIYAVKHLPSGKADKDTSQTLIYECWCRIEVIGGSVYWDNQQTEDAISHRIFVRQVKGKTRPQDLPRMIECESDGIRYRSKRVTDCNGEGRFTMIEAEVLNASAT